MKTLLVCERSGGHIFPALVIGKKIREQLDSAGKSNEVYFFATASFLKQYLEKESFRVFGKSFSRRILIFEIVWRFFEAIYLLYKIRPDQVIGFGGRDGFFLVLFAALLSRKTAIYEPNIKMGKANHVLSFFVNKVLCGFSETLSGSKAVIVGIPLRENIKKIDRDIALRNLGLENKFTIFFCGGSQGSAFINKIAIHLGQALAGNFQIIHLTGRLEYAKVKENYHTIINKAFVKDFYYAMEELYSAADLIVCRAGASTLAEIAFYKLPSILIPHPKAGGHQTNNANYFKQRGAAYIFNDNDFSFDEFHATIKQVMERRELLSTMRDSLEKINIGINYTEFGVPG